MSKKSEDKKKVTPAQTGKAGSESKDHGNVIHINAESLEKLNQMAASWQLNESHPQLNIKFAALQKESCAYSFFERVPGGDFRQVDIKKSSTVCHQDLTAAFAAFNGHLAVICEEVPKEDITDIEQLKADIDQVEERMRLFHVTAVSFDGGLTGSIVLYGHKILSTGDLLGLETPKINITPEYLFFNELHAAALTLMEEVSLYYYGKAAPSAQQELFKQEVENQ